MLEADRLAGLVGFLGRRIDEALLLYAFTGEAVCRVEKVERDLRLRVLGVDGRKSGGFEPPRLERVRRFLDRGSMRDEVDKVFERLKSLEELGLKASVIVDTNVAINGYLELMLDELGRGGYRSRVVILKMVVQELFQRLTTDVYKGQRYEEKGVNNFPKAGSREARYALSVIMRGFREGLCSAHGRVVPIAAGERGYEYISDLIILEQAEEYSRSAGGATLFATSDFALSAISTIPITEYLRPPAGRDEGILDPVVLEQLAVALGIFEIVSDDMRLAVAYSWKGVTLEDYHSRCLAVAAEEGVVKELREHVTLGRELDREREALWLRMLEGRGRR